MRNLLTSTHWFLSSQVGIDLIKFLAFAKSIPWFLRSLRSFRRDFRGKLVLKPCMHDRTDQAGAATNEYFIQDLLVAQLVHQKSPRRHLDIGSRIDGFVAHVASYRNIDVMDVRPLSNFSDRIRFLQHDLMSPIQGSSNSDLMNFYDSVSCLHALEHFGLGRYGDPIKPTGWHDGLTGIASLLEQGGILIFVPPSEARKSYSTQIGSLAQGPYLVLQHA